MVSRFFKLLFLLLLPLVYFIFSINDFNLKEQVFTDANTFDISIISDSVEGGSSIVSGGLVGNKTYDFTYILGSEGYDYPYALFMITRRDSNFIDFSKYDYVSLKLRSSSSDFLTLTAFVFIDGFTDINIHSTYLPLELKISVDNKSKEYNLSMDNFYTPRWWYLNNNITEPDSIDYSLKSVIYLSLSNHEDKPTGIEDKVIIEKISTIKDFKRVFFDLIKYLLLYYLLLVIIFILYKQICKLKKHKVVAYRSLEILQEHNTDNRVEEYIGLNYNNPLLSLTKVSEELNLTVKFVSEYINKEFTLSFPAYLNNIRISEAKRILKTTDRKIIDIAIDVGFNSAGHFNRVFKNMENCTPSEYRKRNLLGSKV